MTRREDNAPGGGGGVRWSARAPARALLRAGYATVTFPLRTAAETALSRLDGRAPLRVAYSELLITVDDAGPRGGAPMTNCGM
ncbi:hypothetical protein NVS88_04670 [Corynebacteriales bacterium D3-21]|uniref:Uncharacterized protein n=1 Tax=Speluncibacter jeojiensis TaxID=2710754 RepID=A0A9X4RCS6_9ACTN|nr:hypothetical protein [Corynebacteriales bacterium D3-21]